MLKSCCDSVHHCLHSGGVDLRNVVLRHSCNEEVFFTVAKKMIGEVISFREERDELRVSGVWEFGEQGVPQ